MLSGASGTGKTCFSWIQQKRNPFYIGGEQFHMHPTIGVDCADVIYTTNIGNILVRYWDVSGNVAFESVHKVYNRLCDGAIFFYGDKATRYITRRYERDFIYDFPNKPNISVYCMSDVYPLKYPTDTKLMISNKDPDSHKKVIETLLSKIANKNIEITIP